MEVYFFSKLFRRYGFHRVVRIMRGYRILKKTNSLKRIPDVQRDLTIKHLEIKDSHFSKWLFGEGLNNAEIICRQYLLIHGAGLNLNRALLYASGKPGSSVICYLPTEWQKIIKDQGFQVASWRSTFLWNAFIGMMLVYGILTIAKIIISGIAAVLKQSSQPFGRYVYFYGLGAGNLPQPSKDGRSHDIITWYSQWQGKGIGDIDTLCHGVMSAKQRTVNGKPVVSIAAPIPPLERISSIACFTLWGLEAVLLSGWDFLRGRWWHALMLNQAALAAQVRMQKPERLAKEYLFHNSGLIYRPLWTYEAEKRGSRITFYFYSTNCEGFKQPDGYPQPIYGYEAMNWPHYLVWDEYQADFVRRAVGIEADISVVGPIWFNASAEEMPIVRAKYVAVFDVTPHRSSRYQTLGMDFEYYVPNTCIPFIIDIQKLTKDLGYNILWKRKRNIGSTAHPKYRNFLERLSEAKNVTIIDPDISANRVIEKSDLVISMPFTSTALIARELAKPSCYYDPSGLVQKDDRAAHGIEIVSGPEELKKWLHNQMMFESHITEAMGLS